MSLYFLGTILNENILRGVVCRFDVAMAFLENAKAYVTKTSVSSHFKQLLSHICYLIPALMLTLFIPVRLGHLFIPFVSRLQFRAPQSRTIDLESPAHIENMLFQFLFPIIMDRVRYGLKISSVFEFYFNNACRVLDLNDCLQKTPPTGTLSSSFLLDHTHLLFIIPIIFFPLSLYFYPCNFEWFGVG